MSHTGQQCFRRIGEWECLALEKKVGNVFHLTDSKSVTIRVKEEDLEPYPTHVRAKEDFEGGQRFEIFEIREPLVALTGFGLEVWTRQDSKVRIPTWIAEIVPDPLWDRSCAV
jgi:hypothetical protein